MDSCVNIGVEGRGTHRVYPGIASIEAATLAAMLNVLMLSLA